MWFGEYQIEEELNVLPVDFHGDALQHVDVECDDLIVLEVELEPDDAVEGGVREYVVHACQLVQVEQEHRHRFHDLDVDFALLVLIGKLMQ
jgi:hypothetical protein